MDESVNNGKSYVDDDVKGRPFVWFTVGFVIFTIVSFLFVYWSYDVLSDYHVRNQPVAPTRVQTGETAPPAPQLQSDPVADMVAMDAAQNAVLDSYGWIDEEHGIVRIPVDKAAVLILERSDEEVATAPEGEPEETVEVNRESEANR